LLKPAWNGRPLARSAVLLSLAAALASCGPDSGGNAPAAGPGPEPVRSVYSVDEDAGFFDAPFPAEHMRRPDGTVRYGLLPNPASNPVTKLYLDQADRESRGFSRAGVVYLPFDGPVAAENLPATPARSLDADARVFLVNVDPSSERCGERVPVYAHWKAEPSVYVPGNVLALLPFQGVPLAPGAFHAAVALVSLGGGEGRPLAPAPAIAAMREGRVPEGAWGPVTAEAFSHLWAYCDREGIPREAVAAAAVFRTGDHVSGMRALREAAASLPDPEPYDLSVLRVHDTYTIVQGRMVVPVWQDGERPYWFGGGRIRFEDGVPVRQWDEEVRFAVSVPHRHMPPGGFPLLFYANGQGGSYTQVFDRGPTGESSGIPGEGPGLVFAHRGIACLDIEAATVGPRHPQGSTEGLAFFNFVNLAAFRDNVRQAASEFTLLVKMARHLRIPAGLVPGAEAPGGEIRYDPAQFYFWGHSTGASIGELVLAVEPGFRAGILSGAGVSWAYNLVMKQAPFELEPVFRLLTGADRIDVFHPFSLVFQALCDPVEAAYYAPLWLDPAARGGAAPPNVLLVMGIFDRYFPPLMIDGLIAAGGLDLAGPLEREETLEALALSGRRRLPLPARGNILTPAGPVTGLAVQHRTPEDVDGHYAPFYLPGAKFQYTCFLESLARTGEAVLPAANPDPFADCGGE